MILLFEMCMHQLAKSDDSRENFHEVLEQVFDDFHP